VSHAGIKAALGYIRDKGMRKINAKTTNMTKTSKLKCRYGEIQVLVCRSFIDLKNIKARLESKIII